MITVIETKDGFEPISGNPTLDSRDNETRAPLAAVLHESWTAEERAKFGVYLVEPMAVPDGKVAVGLPRYERDRAGVVVQIFDIEDQPGGVPQTVDRTLLHPSAVHILKSAGDMNAGHSHELAHSHLLIMGAVKIEYADRTTEEFSAPSIIDVEANVFHRFTALEDNTAFFCVFPRKTAF